MLREHVANETMAKEEAASRDPAEGAADSGTVEKEAASPTEESALLTPKSSSPLSEPQTSPENSGSESLSDGEIINADRARRALLETKELSNFPQPELVMEASAEKSVPPRVTGSAQPQTSQSQGGGVASATERLHVKIAQYIHCDSSDTQAITGALTYINSVCGANGFPLDQPFHSLPGEVRDMLVTVVTEAVGWKWSEADSRSVLVAICEQFEPEQPLEKNTPEPTLSLKRDAGPDSAVKDPTKPKKQKLLGIKKTRRAKKAVKKKMPKRSAAPSAGDARGTTILTAQQHPPLSSPRRFRGTRTTNHHAVPQAERVDSASSNNAVPSTPLSDDVVAAMQRNIDVVFDDLVARCADIL